MIETLAIVTKVFDNGYVKCQQGVSGLCGACNSKSDSCDVNVFDKKKSQKEIIVKSLSSHNLQESQVVRLGIPEKSVYISVLISYAIPLFALIIGSFIGSLLASSDSKEIDLFCIFGGGIGVLVGAFLSYLVARICVKTIWSPKLIGVLPIQKVCNKANIQ